MADLDGEVTAWFSSHLVMLEMSYTVKHRNKPHEDTRTYYTGFLLWEKTPEGDKGTTIWVTAGHCMEEIEEAILGRPDYYSNVAFRLIDMIHCRAVSTAPVPFDYQAAKYKSWAVHRDDSGDVSLGWDFGVILLRPHYSTLLFANNITPIDENNWNNIPEEFDRYFMLGVPAEQAQRVEQGVWTVRPSMIRISKLAERPECYCEHRVCVR